MTTCFRWACVCAALLAPAAATAQLGGEIRLTGAFGGEKLATVSYSDGSDSDLPLGSYFSITAGPILEAWSSGASAIELQGMVGWGMRTTGPKNGNTEDRLTFHRFPLEALAFYVYRFADRDVALRFGGGVSRQLMTDVTGSGSLDGYRLWIGNATGRVAEASLVMQLVNVGMRLNRVEHRVGPAGIPVSGSSVAFFLSLTNTRRR